LPPSKINVPTSSGSSGLSDYNEIVLIPRGYDCSLSRWERSDTYLQYSNDSMKQRSNSVAYPIASSLFQRRLSYVTNRKLNFCYIEAPNDTCLLPIWRQSLLLRVGENSCEIALVNFTFTGNSRSYIAVESS